MTPKLLSKTPTKIGTTKATFDPFLKQQTLDIQVTKKSTKVLPNTGPNTGKFVWNDALR